MLIEPEKRNARKHRRKKSARSAAALETPPLPPPPPAALTTLPAGEAVKVEIPDLLPGDPLSGVAREIAQQMAVLVFPVEPDIETTAAIEKGPPSLQRYTPHIHAALCRYVMLGLTPQAAAEAASVSKATLTVWLNYFPKLASDLQAARQLSAAFVMVLLRRFMVREDAEGFKAIKLYLERRTSEFTPRQQVEVSTERPDAKAVAASIRQNIYGIIDDAEPGGVEDGGNDGIGGNGEAQEGVGALEIDVTDNVPGIDEQPAPDAPHRTFPDDFSDL